MSQGPRRHALQLPAPLPAAAPGAPSPVDPALLAAMQGGSPTARAQLARGEARLVVTGQQPSFPLPLGLTLQKVATAVALASHLSATGDLPVYPCFWSGGDDSDFDEAAGQRLPRQGRRPLDVALPAALAQKGAFVGDLDPGPAYAELIALPGVDADLARHAVRAGEDLGSRELRLVLERFPEEPLFAIDARSPALRAAAAPLYVRYAAKRLEFARALDAAGARLAADGTEPPCARGSASGRCGCCGGDVASSRSPRTTPRPWHAGWKRRPTRSARTPRCAPWRRTRCCRWRPWCWGRGSGAIIASWSTASCYWTCPSHRHTRAFAPGGTEIETSISPIPVAAAVLWRVAGIPSRTPPGCSRWRASIWRPGRPESLLEWTLPLEPEGA